jgi:hypothetical protein
MSTHLHVEQDRPAHLMVGFEFPRRSTRKSGGIPQQGKWDANGGTFFVNNEELPAPRWKNPGTRRYEGHTWGGVANEIPYIDEELYWLREPVKVNLKKGANKVLFRVPWSYRGQHWQAVMVPVKRAGTRWVEDESIISRR